MLFKILKYNEKIFLPLCETFLAFKGHSNRTATGIADAFHVPVGFAEAVFADWVSTIFVAWPSSHLDIRVIRGKNLAFTAGNFDFLLAFSEKVTKMQV